MSVVALSLLNKIDLFPLCFAIHRKSFKPQKFFVWITPAVFVFEWLCFRGFSFFSNVLFSTISDLSLCDSWCLFAKSFPADLLQLFAYTNCRSLLLRLKIDLITVAPYFWVATFDFTKLVPGSRSRSKTAQDLSGLSGFPARFERFERFGRFFWKNRSNRSNLAWKTAQKPLKNRSKTAHFLRLFFSGFSSQIWAVFEYERKSVRFTFRFVDWVVRKFVWRLLCRFVFGIGFNGFGFDQSLN